MTENHNSLHSLSLEQRKQLKITGVKDVASFNELEIKAQTDYSMLLIKGNNLHIEVLDLAMGELEVTGEITALVYSDSVQPKSVLKRLFA